MATDHVDIFFSCGASTIGGGATRDKKPSDSHVVDAKAVTSLPEVFND
jgi:hypothetical protein